jgi:hypothetical protein
MSRSTLSAPPSHGRCAAALGCEIGCQLCGSPLGFGSLGRASARQRRTAACSRRAPPQQTADHEPLLSPPRSRFARDLGLALEQPAQGARSVGRDLDEAQGEALRASSRATS